MKNIIYEFIIEYVAYYKKTKEEKQKISKVFDFPEDNEIKRILNVIETSNPESYANILALDDQGVLFEYLEFLLRYYDKKKSLKLKTLKLSMLTKIPVLSIRRIENLQNIPSFETMNAIAKAVNVKVYLKRDFD